MSKSLAPCLPTVLFSFCWSFRTSHCVLVRLSVCHNLRIDLPVALKRVVPVPVCLVILCVWLRIEVLNSRLCTPVCPSGAL
jgi:hypothetical protein